IDTQIRELEEQIAKPPQSVDASATSELNPLRQELRQKLLQAEVDLAGAAAQDEVLERNVTQLRGRLRELGEAELSLNALERQALADMESYRIYVRNREQAGIASKLASANLGDLEVANPASLPMSPVRPRRLLYLAIALAGSLVIALAAPFAAEHNDTSI